jgi:lysophospholipase L1-like esterase
VPVRNPVVLWMVAGITLALTGGCAVPTQAEPSVYPSVGPSALRYVALGDSYTIGTSVTPAESWPRQLVDRLGGSLILAGNLATNGFSTEDLILHELPALDALRPEFVTVQIGVNDVVRGVPEATFAENVDFILDDLLGRLPPDRILAVATPDYTVTPMGASFGNPAQQSAAIARFNAILEAASEARGIAFVPDIFAISRAAAGDRSLVANDGLHPRGAQYALWVDAIAPVVADLLDR